MSAAEPLHGQAVLPSSGPSQFWPILRTVIVAVLAFALWLGVILLLTVSVPKSAKLFDDFKLLVPWWTQLVLRGAWWVVPLYTAITFALCCYYRWKWAWLYLLIVLPFVLNMLIYLSLYLPTAKLFEALNGTRPELWIVFWG